MGIIWVVRYKTDTESHLEREKEDGKLLAKCMEELKKKGVEFDLLKEVDALRRAKSMRVEAKTVRKWSARDFVTLFFFTVSCIVLGLTNLILCEHKRPKKSRSLDDAAVKISAEEYEYEIFRSPEEYKKANLEPPRYDLPEKYTPQRAAVTVVVRPPLPEAGSRGTMRSFSVSARPPAPAKKISLGSKKAEPAKLTDPSAEALVPTGLPLATTHPSGKSGDHGDALTTKRGKEKEAEVEERIKELEGKLKTAEETGRRILERADLGEKILTDPVLLARHICRGQETGEAVLAAISRTPVGEDLMYEFGTWAFNSGRKAMQNDVRTALEVAMDEADLSNILAVLPEEVPDPGPTPFSSVPEGRNLPVPVVEVSAGPPEEVAAIAGPSTELGATLSAGPSVEGDTEPGVEPPKKAD
nr:uncharacterized protein LOC109190491 [Ipomoea batatas]